MDPGSQNHKCIKVKDTINGYPKGCKESNEETYVFYMFNSHLLPLFFWMLMIIMMKKFVVFLITLITGIKIDFFKYFLSLMFKMDR